ncbi:MAG: LURP-one-related family protein [Candidatus Dormibacteraeota bacterium]|nr:LURP-one-related family protein [Candidatus Dormibacteraeota bacterium]
MSEGAWTTYQLRRKLFSMGEDYWIENDRGQRVFKVDGKVLRVRETFALQDPDGAELASVETKLIAVRPTMTIERDGQVYATVKKALFTLLRQHYTVSVRGAPDLEAQGNITNHEYEIRAYGEVVATISKRWFSFRDSYGVSIRPGQDPVLVLAAAVCIDEMSEREHEH